MGERHFPKGDRNMNKFFTTVFFAVLGVFLLTGCTSRAQTDAERRAALAEGELKTYKDAEFKKEQLASATKATDTIAREVVRNSQVTSPAACRIVPKELTYALQGYVVSTPDMEAHYSKVSCPREVASYKAEIKAVAKKNLADAEAKKTKLAAKHHGNHIVKK